MKKERRRTPRIRIPVPIKLAPKGERVPIDARAVDISSDGAYCCVGRFIPLNSEVDVELGLPDSGVPCKGIVVRNVKRAGKDEYGIALFFSPCSKNGKRRIVEFIDDRLRQAGIKAPSRGKRVKDFVEEKGYVSRRRGLEISSAKFRVLRGDVVISSKGLSCRADRRVPLFNEIAVNIVIPSKGRGAGDAIQCSAVVVSCDKVRGKDRYDLTMYFIGLSPEDRTKIDSFIKSGKKAAGAGRK